MSLGKKINQVITVDQIEAIENGMKMLQVQFVLGEEKLITVNQIEVLESIQKGCRRNLCLANKEELQWF